VEAFSGIITISSTVYYQLFSERDVTTAQVYERKQTANMNGMQKQVVSLFSLHQLKNPSI